MRFDFRFYSASDDDKDWKIFGTNLSPFIILLLERRMTNLPTIRTQTHGKNTGHRMNLVKINVKQRLVRGPKFLSELSQM